MKKLPGRTENSVKNRFNCLFKRIKEEKLQNRKDVNIKEALSKIDGAQNDESMNEEVLIEELISRKKSEISSNKISS